jgi:6-phosphogluconolactonase
MKIEVLDTTELVAQRAAAFIAEEARVAVATRGSFVMALSGGTTPWAMLRALRTEELSWPAIQVVQVDERVAPPGDPDRNLTHLHETLLGYVPIRAEQIHGMPVESPDLEASAEKYAMTLRRVAGPTPVLDLVHLGMGADGHTASLVPGDPALGVEDRDVAITGDYKGRRRMTLTYPIINRSRRILWVVTGSEKVSMLNRLLEADETIPAGRVRPEHAVLIADRAAAGELTMKSGRRT